jgi:hypothetical protein
MQNITKRMALFAAPVGVALAALGLLATAANAAIESPPGPSHPVAAIAFPPGPSIIGPDV